MRETTKRRIDAALDNAARGLVDNRDERKCPPRWRNVLRTLADEVSRLVQLDRGEPETAEERAARALYSATSTDPDDPNKRPTVRPPSRPDNKVPRNTKSWHPKDDG